jgi:hypothetical protein
LTLTGDFQLGKIFSCWGVAALKRDGLPTLRSDPSGNPNVCLRFARPSPRWWSFFNLTTWHSSTKGDSNAGMAPN